MNLVWKLLRQHISKSQLTGFFVANLAGMFIVLLSVQVYSDLRPLFSGGESFLNKDYLILTKKINAFTSLAGNGSIFTPEEIEEIKTIYQNCGYPVIFTSASKEKGIEELRAVLNSKTTAVAGPSGVGKSSLTNLLAPGINMETGEISKKLGRGRHTTRHSQLIELWQETYLMDTPGFTSFYVENMEKQELRYYFPEFQDYEGNCRFQGCTHTHEPGCMVKEALEHGKISYKRYENYLEMYRELEEKRRY